MEKIVDYVFLIIWYFIIDKIKDSKRLVRFRDVAGEKSEV